MAQEEVLEVTHGGTRLCRVCGSSTMSRRLSCAAKGPNFGHEVTFSECSACGFVFAPDNTHEFTGTQDFAGNNQPGHGGGRAGSRGRAGREFEMALMAHEILARSATPARTLLIYGPGLSEDHVHIAARLPGCSVFVTDLRNFQDAANFVPLASDVRFDVVIACEVIEHFLDPLEDMRALLAKVSPGGLAVCSTNISDGGSLSDLEYPFIKGHTAYYSGRALIRIARLTDPAIAVDFRTPSAAMAQLGPRKRYVLATRDPRTSAAISQYFAQHMFAPSEPSRAPPATSRLRRAWRRIARRIQPWRQQP